MADASISSEAKGAIAEKFAQAEKRLIEGADEELQLIDMLASAARAIQKISISADRERHVVL